MFWVSSSSFCFWQSRPTQDICVVVLWPLPGGGILRRLRCAGRKSFRLTCPVTRNTSTDTLTTYSLELDASVAVGVANNRIESIRRISAQNQDAPCRVFVVTLGCGWLRRRERPPRERFEELVLLSPLEKRGYCFFPDAEAAADAVAVSFLYSALA